MTPTMKMKVPQSTSRQTLMIQHHRSTHRSFTSWKISIVCTKDHGWKSSRCILSNVQTHGQQLGIARCQAIVLRWGLDYAIMDIGKNVLSELVECWMQTEEASSQPLLHWQSKTDKGNQLSQRDQRAYGLLLVIAWSPGMCRTTCCSFSTVASSNPLTV